MTFKNGFAAASLATTVACKRCDVSLMHMLRFFIILASFFAFADRPNIILIMVDDMGYAGPSAAPYGNPHYKTPGMDWLIEEGMCFTDFHSSGTVCSPTRAGLLTGRYQQRAGIEAVIHPHSTHPEHRKGLSESETTFAERFKSAGYATGLVGKWHLGYAAETPSYHPMNHGFDSFRGYLSGNIDYINHWGDHMAHDWWHDRKQVKEAGYSTHLINKYALEFIEQHKDEPFCLYIAHESPHAPVQGPGDPIQRGPGAAKRKTPHDEAMKQMILEMDKGLLQIRNSLGAHKLDQRTLVIFISDNGDAPRTNTGHPRYRGHKGQVYEGGTRVPAIARWPGRIKPGSRSDALAISLDLMPTILSVAGIDSPDNLDGIDISPALFQGEPLPGRPLFWGSLSNGGRRSEAMREGPWKLVVQHPKAKPGSFEKEAVELYNLDADPSEKTSLAAKHPDRTADMLARTKSWFADCAKTGTIQPGGWIPKTTPDPSFFNGKDLTGWHGNAGFWSVKGGAIVGNSDAKVAKNEFIWSNQIVGDFYLAVDVKLTPGNRNAGIQFRSKSVNDHGQAHGYQADVGAGVWGKLYHEHGRGKLDWNNKAKGIIKDGDWNRYEILAVGDRIWTAINGTLCVAIRDSEGERSGKIALQIHSGPPQTVAYRGLTLTHNPPVTIASMDEAKLNAALPQPKAAAPPPTTGPNWPALIAKHDLGSKDLAWSKPAFDASKWKTMKLPGHFDAGALPNFDGVVWFRKTLELSAEQAAKSATLFLGKIDDMDVTWVNGTRVGGYETPGHHYTVRKYAIPKGLLKAGANHVAVRVMDHGWPGGIAGSPDQLYLQLADERISLANKWRLAAGASVTQMTGKPAPQPAPAKPARGSLSVSQPTEDNSAAAELVALEIAEGYEVSLFADETDGIANPIAIRWDSRGRLWVLCSLVYPQIVPTDPPNDTLVILDGDTSTIFADGLDMPMSFALGDGGVYLGEGPDILFLRDTDGDDKADSREVIFSGFGTGDTHQNINSFTWSPDGELFFCQGLHCFSRVETPWGIKRLNEHGVWRMRPRSRQLHAFRGGSGQNPWGISFAHWGEPFVKGNNNAVSELLPIMIDTAHFQRPLDIGGTRIKSMICEIVDSPILPDDLQGDILIAGYFGHLIDRLDMSRDGAGHRGELQAPLIKTSHPSFRPVDIQTGPDGALYIADWYNPIIGHYQASLRHPNRDKTHGRIWRLAAKDSKPLPTVDLTKLRTPQLLERLRDTFLAERKRIRAELSNRDDVIPALKDWADTDAEEFEALALYAWHESPHAGVLSHNLHAESAGLRAFATRLVGRWHDRIFAPLDLLYESITDPDPRVRLEAIVALSYLPQPDAFPLACQALDQPTDRFILAALSQAAHATKDYWWPTLPFENTAHLAFALKAVGGKDTAGPVRDLLAKPDLPAESATRLKSLLAEIGTPQDLRWILERGAIPALVERKTRPAGELEPLIDLNDPIAIELAGIWKLRKLGPAITAKATPASPLRLRRAAVLASARLTGKVPPTDQLDIASQARCEIDLASAADFAIRELRKSSALGTTRSGHGPDKLADSAPAVVTPFLAYKDGPKILAAKADAATRPAIRTVFAAAGHYEPGLAETGLPTYSKDFVNALTAEVKASGDVVSGAKVYANPALACAACHKVGDSGGSLGPDLTAVGAGLPIEILIESVLWPKRQVKEGFLSTTLITKSGAQVAGYIETETATQIRIRDAATGAIQTLAKSEIAHRADAGTLMPPGLTAGLSRAELRDLIRFLAEQK